VAGAVVVLVALAIAAVWFFGRSEPVDIIPAHPDEAAEGPQQPDEVAPEIVYGREPRANWDVTGVAGGDRLNVRTGPGLHHAVMATLAPDAVELESTGRVGRVDGVLWREIVVPGDGAGWVHAGYLTETAPALLEDDRRARSDRADREVTS
jgi:uncharacterized protein YgiM (DUF1202 family)